MRDFFLASLVVGALCVIIYCAAVLIARVTDRREPRVIPRSSIVPAKTSMVDTDEHDMDDVHPESINQLVARIEAEEQAARDARRAQV